jgi:hypothetical protein
MDRQQARRDAEIKALEAAVVAAVVAGLADRLDTVSARLRRGVGLAVTAPTAWMLMRRRAALDLAATHPQVAARVARFLPRAARLGAAQVGGTLPDGHDPTEDPLIRRVLDSLDADVRDRIVQAARVLSTDAVTTPTQLDAVLHQADGARRMAETAAGDLTARAVAGGATAAADMLGLSLEWVAEPGACPACAAMDGQVREPGGQWEARRPPLPWPDALEHGAPAHPHCRCGRRIYTGTRATPAAARPRPPRLFSPAGLRARLAAVDTALRSARGRARR